MRIWFKLMKDNRLLRDTTIADESEDTRTHKIFRALDAVCMEFDLAKPIWLPISVNLSGTQRRVSARTALSSRCRLILWSCM